MSIQLNTQRYKETYTEIFHNNLNIFLPCTLIANLIGQLRDERNWRKVGFIKNVFQGGLPRPIKQGKTTEWAGFDLFCLQYTPKIVQQTPKKKKAQHCGLCNLISLLPWPMLQCIFYFGSVLNNLITQDFKYYSLQNTIYRSKELDSALNGMKSFCVSFLCGCSSQYIG